MATEAEKLILANQRMVMRAQTRILEGLALGPPLGNLNNVTIGNLAEHIRVLDELFKKGEMSDDRLGGARATLTARRV